MIFTRDIEQASHIVLIATSKADSLCSASAFYTYLMRLHKKVTLYVNEKELPQNLLFIPWFDKIKGSFPTSADFVVCFGITNQPLEIMACDKILNIDNSPKNNNYGTFNLVDLDSISISQVVFDFLSAEGIVLNPKMATALYGGLIDGSRNFTQVSGTSFAFASTLIQNGAEHQKCVASIAHFRTLSMLRLKAIMLSKMQLKGDGTFACFVMDNNDFKASGAKEAHAMNTLEEVLYLPTVLHVLMVLLQDDEKMRVTLLAQDFAEATEWITEYKELDALVQEIRLGIKDSN
ncbi:MAG: hypothetical protein RBR59_06675 [Sulfurimonadaceae bacterium]|jgi:phosphoesterase RecJ-like protein|nr:hypothetical protein [Sulfurimonadaceae bacterium]